jgi:UDP-N-acetylmuramate dehydrogenase
VALAAIPGLEVRRDVPLSPKTSFRIGGPAEVLVTPRTAEAVAQTWSFARDAGLPLTVLGGGTNVLVADAGIAGIVMVLGKSFANLREMPRADGGAVWEVGAACKTGTVVRRGVERGLAGTEVLAGIPGTIGGALIMNAGGRQGELSSIVTRVELVDQGRVRWLLSEEAGFGYRRSAFPPNSILLGAELELVPGDVEALRRDVKAAQARRRATQPLGLHNAGSIFKNPPGDAAGRLVEAAGCKGWREGAAEVSAAHANFIVNLGGATAGDVMTLVRRVRGRVEERAGVRLELEVRLLGEHPGEEGA